MMLFKRKFWLFIFVPFVFLSELQAKIRINEIMPSNLSTIINTDNYNFSGYIELRNTDTLDVDMKSYVVTHYRLKKGLTYELKWSCAISHKFKVPAESYKLLWIDEDSIANHLPYKLDTDGGYVTIYKGSQLVDSISYGAMGPHISYGRGETSMGYMVPSPEADNTACVSSLSLRCAQPKFGTAPGIMADSVFLSLSTLTADASIYYTTDGSEPTIEDGKLYSEPIKIGSNKNIRAKAFKDVLLPSKILTGSYIYMDSKHESCDGFSVPIVSITTDDDYLNDSKIGITVVGSNGIAGEKICTNSTANYNQDWKRPMNFEYFVNGKQVLSQEIEAEVEGGCSRTESVKSFSLKTSKKTGDNLFNYYFFASKPKVQHQTLHLRNGGTGYSHVRFRDGLMQTFAVGMNVDYQAYQPVAYYLNGKYKGLMGLRERTNVDYLKANYDYEEEDVDLISLSDQTQINVSKGDRIAYDDLISYLENTSTTSSSYYDGACRLMDMDEYIEYQIIEQFMVNGDWPGNNTKIWRYKKDGRFRWIIYDMDMALGLDGYEFLGDESQNMIKWCRGEGETYWANNQSWMTTIFKHLSENEEFKNKFVTKFLIHLNSTFSEKNINTVFDSITGLLNKEYCAYSGGTSAESAASDMKKFALARPKYVYEHLLEYAGADSMVNLSITSNVPGAVFTMNGERTPSYNGRYYTNYDLNVQAYAPLGYRFVRWETSPSFNSGDTPTVTYSLMNKSSQWRYFNEGKAPAGDWISTGYDDSSWKTGAGRFGYNTSTDNSGYNVVLDYGGDPENKYVTAYFRSTFNVSNLSDVLQLKGKITFDDGYILYINGKVVDKMNLEDTASYSTLTSTYANDDVRDFSIDKSFVKEGVNTIAVEMHQTVLNSSDLTFDLSISAVSIDKTDRTSEVLNVTLEKDQTIEAVFEKIEAPVLPSLVINEVCASSNDKSKNSDDYSNYPDWIEIYNKGTETYDLAGMYLSDNKNNPTKSQIPYGYDQTVIKPGEHKILWAKGDAVDGPLYLNFKIDADEVSHILLSCVQNSELKTLDDVTYALHPTNASYGRVLDASLDWKVFSLCGDKDSTSLATPSNKNGSIFCPGSSDEIEPIAEKEHLTVYPNPSSSELYISSEENMKQVAVYDHLGRMIDLKQIDIQHFKMNVSDWNSGVYILQVMTDKSVYQKKVVKQ